MAPPVCDISFEDNSHGVFLAGQTIVGQVDIQVPKAKKVRSVYLRLTGQGSCKWAETRETGSSAVFSSREEYAAHTVVFLSGSSSESSEEVELGEGSHRYRFSYRLPPECPTSFEGDFGYVRYTIRIVFERPWKYDLTYKIAFTVVQQLDLNRISPPLNEAIVKENMRQFSCGPCRSAPMIMTVCVPMTGYVPGQLVRVTVDIMNKSRKDISEVKLKLRRQVKYLSQSPSERSKTVFCTLVKYQCSGVDRDRSAGYERRLLIPPEPPTRSSTIIRIEYFIEIIAKVVGLHASPRVKIPITIGTVPLANLNKSQEQSSVVDGNPLLRGVSTTSVSNLATQHMASSLQSLKMPHSFEESPSRAAIDIQEDDEQQTLGAKPFAPRYPVYKFGEGAPSTAASTTATATLTTTPITPAEITTTEPVKGSNGVS
ncbi:arrestin domain-containing protein 17-like [Culex pipiens pallens]|uniref:arrestin domain-containing protein 17-like n=1 Tax=Culex pipiens pallens TaxID=42434 RepID=UPI0019549BD5|nr:arrestin domain-containing protein 17-like [Culex pipiens pallens]